ncbi:MAG: FkbM family methyltransferase, partial [Acidimicrobiales bacterium]
MRSPRLPNPWGIVTAGRRVPAAFRYYERDPVLLARHTAFWLLRQVTPVAMVEGDGMRYLVRTDDVLGLRLWVSRHFEQDLMASALEFAGGVEGRTFVDVGANLGTSTIPALKVFGADRVVAFEPMPSNCELLRCNLVLNGVEDRVDVHQVAVSDHDGTELME